MDRQLNKLCLKYPETERLRQVPGVGPVTALAYVLTIEDPHRFTKSRQVGNYLGLTPKRDQSGKCDKQLRISKAGNTYLRSLLVSCGHYIIGPFGPESDLRKFGISIIARGGKNAKKRAAVRKSDTRTPESAGPVLARLGARSRPSTRTARSGYSACSARRTIASFLLGSCFLR